MSLSSTCVPKSSNMEKLIEVEEQEVILDFHLSVKCRTDVHLRSLHPSSPVAFKVQTSSPHKFLVNPPSGLLSPLTSTSFQVILRPQSQLPSSFPRSTSDRFLIKAAVVSGKDVPNHPASVNQWFAARSHMGTHDTKLKVVYVGAVLLQQVVHGGDVEAVRQILRRQKSLVPQLTPADSAALLRSATSTHDPTILELLLESGLDPSNTDTTTTTAIGPTTTTAGFPKSKEPVRSKPEINSQSKGWTALHTAAASGTYDTLLHLLTQIRESDPKTVGSVEIDGGDCDGRTPLHLATSKGYMRCVKALVENGADKNAKSKDGRTALHRAAANGDYEMVALLLDVGADPAVVTARGRTPLDVARDKGHKVVVEVLERGELILTAARRGDIQRLESLLKKGVSTGSHDQYGITALHSAAIKGHRDVVCLLVDYGMDLNCRDVEGHTPLHLGVEGGWVEIVEVLISLGADVNAKTNRGATPLYMAKSMGYEDISRLLVSRGAASDSVASSSSSMSSTSYG